jgi:soluble lytic murein transglycosylase-like protein
MKTTFVIGITLMLATAAVADERKFTASSVPSARLKKAGRIVISNDQRSITAHRFFGNIREALVSIRSTRTIAMRPFGAAVYNANASVSAPGHLTSAIEDASRAHGVDPRLVAAVARRESAFRVNAVSPVGACGIMQLMPATAKYLGVKDVFDARENIFGGTRYLRTLLDTFNGDLDLALAAYNAGPGAVEKYRGIPPYRETRAYVAAVKATYEKSLRASS